MVRFDISRFLDLVAAPDADAIQVRLFTGDELQREQVSTDVMEVEAAPFTWAAGGSDALPRTGRPIGDVMAAIDAATNDLCPCGAAVPADSASIYCGDDCRPSHIGPDTGASAMRWRPDLVTADLDDDLHPVAEPAHRYRGRFNGTVYERAGRAGWHLRLDDGHRWVGLDVERPDADTMAEAWRRLERELTDPRRLADEDAHSDDYWLHPVQTRFWLDEHVGFARASSQPDRQRPTRNLRPWIDLGFEGVGAVTDEPMALGWIEVAEDGVRLVTAEGVSGPAVLPEPDPSILDGLPDATISGCLVTDDGAP